MISDKNAKRLEEFKNDTEAVIYDRCELFTF